MSTSVVSSFGISQFLIKSVELKESVKESKYFIVKCSLKIKEKIVQTHAIIDFGATGIAFVDKEFVYYYERRKKFERNKGIRSNR